MTDNPYQPMAQAWIAFWQKQLADGLMDEKLVGQMVDWLHHMQFQPHEKQNPTPHGTEPPSPSPNENPTVSPEHAGNVVAGIEQRIGAIESELRELKAQLAKLPRDSKKSSE